MNITRKDRYRALPQSTAQRIEDLTAREVRLGHVPTVMPKVLLQSPIWYDPRFASSRQAFGTEYVPRSDPREIEISSQANILPLHPGRGEAGGLLRHLDLDVVMALSFAWTITGDRHVEMRQKDILHLMGYEDLTQAPYNELRASIRRLAATKIAIYPKDLPENEIDWWQILEHNERFVIREQGQPVAFRATLSEGWEACLRGIADWQVVDLQCYAHLVRHHRRMGLARTLYLYLASWRTSQRTFELPLRWIEERFADRNSPNDLTSGLGSFRFKNPINAQSKLFRAFKALHQTGVIALDEVKGPRDSVVMRGQFVKPKDLPALPDVFAPRPHQTVLVHTSMWDERVAELAVIDDHGTNAMTTPPPKSPQAAPPPPAIESPIAQHLPRLLRLVHVSKGTIDEARKAGWDDAAFSRVLFAALWEGHHQRIRSPAGWAAKIIRTDQVWTKERLAEQYPLAEIAAWALGPDGPLGKPRKGPASANGDTGTISPPKEKSS